MSDVTKRRLLRALRDLAEDSSRTTLVSVLRALADAAEYEDQRAKALVVLSDAGVVHHADEQAAAVKARDAKRALQQAGIANRKRIEAEVAQLAPPTHVFGDEAPGADDQGGCDAN